MTNMRYDPDHRVSHPEVAWTVLRLDLGERMLHMAKCDGGESGGGVGG